MLKIKKIINDKDIPKDPDFIKGKFQFTNEYFSEDIYIGNIRRKKITYYFYPFKEKNKRRRTYGAMTLEPGKAKNTFSGSVIIYGDYHNFNIGYRSEIDKRNRKNDPYDVHHYFKQIIRYSKEEKKKFGKIISNVDQMDKRFKMERRKTKYKPFYKAVYFKIYAFRRINED